MGFANPDICLCISFWLPIAFGEGLPAASLQTSGIGAEKFTIYLSGIAIRICMQEASICRWIWSLFESQGQEKIKLTERAHFVPVLLLQTIRLQCL